MGGTALEENAIHGQGVGLIDAAAEVFGGVTPAAADEVRHVETRYHRPQPAVVVFVGIVLEAIRKRHVQLRPVAVNRFDDRVESRQQRHLLRCDLRNIAVHRRTLPVVGYTQQ